MKTSISGTLLQTLPTMHPDMMIEVPFKYIAVVDENEEVEIKWVVMVYENQTIDLRITPTSTADGLNRFLANIREHARAEAYKISKKSNVPTI